MPSKRQMSVTGLHYLCSNRPCHRQPIKNRFMCADKDNHKPGLLKIVLTNKCPRCRRVYMFLYPNPYQLKNLMKMPVNCPVCVQLFEIVPGFYYGTVFVSYALAVMVCVASFIAWAVLICMSLQYNRLLCCPATNPLPLPLP